MHGKFDLAADSQSCGRTSCRRVEGMAVFAPGPRHLRRRRSRVPLHCCSIFAYSCSAHLLYGSRHVCPRRNCFCRAGAHDSAKLDSLLELFIKKYVQCHQCGNPETRIKIRKDMIHLMCKARVRAHCCMDKQYVKAMPQQLCWVGCLSMHISQQPRLRCASLKPRLSPSRTPSCRMAVYGLSDLPAVTTVQWLALREGLCTRVRRHAATRATSTCATS